MRCEFSEHEWCAIKPMLPNTPRGVRWVDDRRLTSIELAHPRGNVSRLEVIRRSTPVDYAENVKAAAEYARNARSEALEAFYGHTVLREEGNKTKNPPPENKLP